MLKEALNSKGEVYSKESLANDVIQEYKKYDPQDVMHGSVALKPHEAESLALRLRPENHDAKMEELLGVLLDKGISSVLSLIGKMNNPHLDDDFHRFLVQYL